MLVSDGLIPLTRILPATYVYSMDILTMWTVWSIWSTCRSRIHDSHPMTALPQVRTSAYSTIPWIFFGAFWVDRKIEGRLPTPQFGDLLIVVYCVKRGLDTVSPALCEDYNWVTRRDLTQ